jgi:hypothetical protein
MSLNHDAAVFMDPGGELIQTQAGDVGIGKQKRKVSAPVPKRKVRRKPKLTTVPPIAAE